MGEEIEAYLLSPEKSKAGTEKWQPLKRLGDCELVLDRVKQSAHKSVRSDTYTSAQKRPPPAPEPEPQPKASVYL